jgi:hypothetical protein
MTTESDIPVDLYIAAYADPDAAQRDWDDLKALEKNKVIEIDGLVLVSREMDGKIRVRDDAHGPPWNGLGCGRWSACWSHLPTLATRLRYRRRRDRRGHRRSRLPLREEGDQGGGRG